MEIHLLSDQQRKKRAGELGFNQWCQVKANRRYVLQDTWGYSKTVYNIFYGEVLKIESIMNTAEKTFMTDLQKLLY